MRKEEYIKALEELYTSANSITIKIWSSEPNIRDIVRGIKYVISNGYCDLYYPSILKKGKILKKLQKDFGVSIYDKKDAMLKCIELKRYDLLEIIERGV